MEHTVAFGSASGNDAMSEVNFSLMRFLEQKNANLWRKVSSCIIFVKAGEKGELLG